MLSTPALQASAGCTVWHRAALCRNVAAAELMQTKEHYSLPDFKRAQGETHPHVAPHWLYILASHPWPAARPPERWLTQGCLSQDHGSCGAGGN